MGKILFILAGILLLFGLAAGYDMYAGPQFISAPVDDIEQAASDFSRGLVPDFSFETLDGESFSIGDFRGRTVLINFWATWCAPCVAEFPALIELADDYKEQLVLLAVSSDNNVENIRTFIAKQDSEIREKLESAKVFVVPDKSGKITYDLFQTQRYPETIIVAPNGEMVRKVIGDYDWKGAEIRSYLDSLPGV